MGSQLPAGFVLDKKQTSLPDGFTLDAKSNLAPAGTLKGESQRLLGAGEAALQFATGGAAAIPAGLAGIGASLIPGGQTGPEAVQNVSEALTFEPRTEAGQLISQAVSENVLEPIDRFADTAGEVTGNPDDVLGATLVKTAILGAPALFGIRRGGTITKAPKKPTPRQVVARTAAEEGYVTPPSQGGIASSRVASLAEGAGGKIKVNQEAISRNQQVTNKLAGRAVGLPEGVPVTADVLSGIRAQAGRAYESIRDVGQIFTDNKFKRELSAATKRFKNAARDFPELAKNEVTGLVDSLRKSEFDAGSAIDAISLLRSKADVAFRGGDKPLGNAYKSASNAIEGAIGRHLERGSDLGLLDSFRSARQQIAETYSVQDALQGRITGEVSAAQLASQLKKGKPLTGDLRAIADFANTFPDATRLFKGEPLAFSPLDLAFGGASSGLALSLGAGPAALAPLAIQATRPLLRKAALSNVVQKGGRSKGTIRPSAGAVLGGVISGQDQ